MGACGVKEGDWVQAQMLVWPALGTLLVVLAQGEVEPHYLLPLG